MDGAGGGDDDAASLFPFAAAHLPRWLAHAETAYNVGRAAHQLGLPHLAAYAYRRALGDEPSSGAPLPPANPPHALPGSAAASVAPFGALDVRREAAFNLVLLLRAGGDAAGAYDVMQRFLTYD